jgi:leader peptidase (prepilin peptidase)/N-methyltransferase
VALLAASPAVFATVALLFGLAIGSFLNVVIHRLPLVLERQWRAQAAELEGRVAAADSETYNLVRPRSRCPACSAPIRAIHNIPVLSWLLLRGRCASCHAPISVRYPAVELATAVATAAVAWHFGFGLQALLAMIFTWTLISLTGIDIDRQLLPDILTIPLLWIALIASLWYLPGGAAPPVATQDAVVGAVAGYLFLWSVFQLFRLVTGKEGMGYGDFKLFAAIGAWQRRRRRDDRGTAAGSQCPDPVRALPRGRGVDRAPLGTADRRALPRRRGPRLNPAPCSASDSPAASRAARRSSPGCSRTRVQP